jgi:hypothetical protein
VSPKLLITFTTVRISQRENPNNLETCQGLYKKERQQAGHPHYLLVSTQTQTQPLLLLFTTPPSSTTTLKQFHQNKTSECCFLFYHISMMKTMQTTNHQQKLDRPTKLPKLGRFQIFKIQTTASVRVRHFTTTNVPI